MPKSGCSIPCYLFQSSFCKINDLVQKTWICTNCRPWMPSRVNRLRTDTAHNSNTKYNGAEEDRKNTTRLPALDQKRLLHVTLKVWEILCYSFIWALSLVVDQCPLISRNVFIKRSNFQHHAWLVLFVGHIGHGDGGRNPNDAQLLISRTSLQHETFGRRVDSTRTYRYLVRVRFGKSKFLLDS